MERRSHPNVHVRQGVKESEGKKRGFLSLVRDIKHRALSVEPQPQPQPQEASRNGRALSSGVLSGSARRGTETTCDWVREAEAATVTLMWPSSLRRRFEGLMSRWQIF